MRPTEDHGTRKVCFIQERKCHVTSTLNALKLFLRISMNSSQHCLSNLVWFATIIATHSRAENRREGENELLALDWAQSSALKRVDVDEVRSRPLHSLLILLVNMSLQQVQHNCCIFSAAMSYSVIAYLCN